MAKAVVASLDEVPEALRGEYEQRGSQYVLKVEGDHPLVQDAVGGANEKLAEHTRKLQEFRENNVRFFQALGISNQDPAQAVSEALQKIEQLRAVDPDKYRALQETVEKLEKKGVKDGNFDEIVQRAIAPLASQVTSLQESLAAKDKENKDKDLALARKTLEGALLTEATRAGVADSAMEDFVARGMRVFDVVDGKVVARGPDGSPLFSRSKAGQPLSPEEWAVSQQETAPHLFKPSAGGGAPGSGGGPPGGVRTYDGSDEQFLANVADIAAKKVVRADA